MRSAGGSRISTSWTRAFPSLLVAATSFVSTSQAQVLHPNADTTPGASSITAESKPPESPAMPASTLVLAGKTPDLTFLYTGDVIGYLTTCGCKRTPAGGLARKSWIQRQIHATFPSTPLLLL